MQSSGLILLSQQQALQQSMEVVANNIANSSTTGYKRETLAFDSYLSQPERGNKLNFVVNRGLYRDTTGGPITPTGNQLDLAIQGGGYFSVKGSDGNTHYTRGGSFELDRQGQLVTQSGMAVLTESGQPMTLPDTTTAVNVSPDGFVTARTDNGVTLLEIGKIGVVKFADEQQMKPEGSGLYGTKQVSAPATGTSIVQGALEQSNVEPVTEMTSMLNVYRAYEQATNMVSQDNQRRNDAITKLSKTTV